MPAANIIAQLRMIGVTLLVDNGQLKAIGTDRYALTDEHQSLLREQKREIIAELQREAPSYPDRRGRTPCRLCARLQDGKWCKLKGQEMFGISLLRLCPEFAARN